MSTSEPGTPFIVAVAGDPRSVPRCRQGVARPALHTRSAGLVHARDRLHTAAVGGRVRNEEKAACCNVTVRGRHTQQGATTMDVDIAKTGAYSL